MKLQVVPLAITFFCGSVCFQASAAQTSHRQNGVRTILDQFSKEDPGWKTRMKAMVNIARAGKAAVPILVEALKDPSPVVRELAAHSLMLLADPGTKQNLEQSLDDTETGVRIYASNALGMFGRVEPTDKHKAIRESDNWAVRRHMEHAMDRVDSPDIASLQNELKSYDLSMVDTARLAHVAPDFELTDVLGTRYQLSQFRGKRPVALVFVSIA